MGAENSVLEGCQWEEEVPADSLDWNLQHAITKDSRLITVFQPQKDERKYKDMIQQLAKSLKMLRHPNILRYIGSGKSSEGCFLVTEHCVPLASILDILSPLEVCAGLNDILDALLFLHDKVGVTHNNIGVGAVFVAKDGGWRLGELQHACPFSAATAQFLDACRAYRDPAGLSPEEKQGGVEPAAGQGHVRDMFAMGVFIEQLSEHLTELGEFSKTFEQKIGACMSADPALRPCALELKNDSLFQNDFVRILNFVRNIALKKTEEKTEFFSGLLPRLLALPEELVARRLAIPLLSRFVLLDDTAVTQVVPHLLTPREDSDSNTSSALMEGAGLCPVLSVDLFRSHLIPELQRIFLVHDSHIRLVLLKHFARYVHLFELDALNSDIFPQILLGLRDTSDAIVASSLHALAHLVPLLGGDVVIGGPRKTFFFNGMPNFSAGRETGDRPSSVTDAMRSIKSSGFMSFSNGKPFLKDLAALSSSSSGKLNRLSLNPEEQEKKEKEREHRREEARQRKEERQRKLKLQQLESQQEMLKDNSTSSKILHDNDADALDYSKSRSHSDHDDIIPTKLDSNSKNSKGDNLNENRMHSSPDNSRTRMEEEKFASEGSEEEDWEDWDDGGDTAGVMSQDDLISEEIEAELSRMPGKSHGVKKVATSPDPYRHGSPAEFDSSVSPQVSVVSTPEHMGSKRTDLESGSQQMKPGVGLVDPDAEHPSSDFKLTTGKGLKLGAKNKSAVSSSSSSYMSSSSSSSSATKTTQAKKIAVIDDLGLGYDIKSIELTVVKEEVDFFADMTPDLKPSLSDRGLFIGGDVDPQEKISSSQVGSGPVASDRFAMTTVETEEDTGGWGDGDDGWGENDF